MAGVFTGGSLLYGSTGRTDLLGPDATAALTRAQWASARRLAGELPDAARIFPTHGFGSFCSATQSEAASSTIGHEKLVNPALTLDEGSYLESLLTGLDAWPAYYAHMAPANLAGPAGPDLSPPRPADATDRAAPARRQRPHHRPAGPRQHEERRRDHHEQLVLHHVHREKPLAPGIDRREQGDDLPADQDLSDDPRPASGRVRDAGDQA